MGISLLLKSLRLWCGFATRRAHVVVLRVGILQFVSDVTRLKQRTVSDLTYVKYLGVTLVLLKRLRNDSADFDVVISIRRLRAMCGIAVVHHAVN